MIRSNWVLDPGKFLTREEASKLLETVRNRAKIALARSNKVAVRDWFIVDLALSTGLRVMEIAQLKCGDFFLSGPICCLLVRKGKGGKKRLVRFNGCFKRHLEEYILWKQSVGEPAGPGGPLILSSNTDGHITTRALEKAFKRSAARAGLPSHYSIHSNDTSETALTSNLLPSTCMNSPVAICWSFLAGTCVLIGSAEQWL
jgi:integrase